MSRIHEALKRAEQERVASQAAQNGNGKDTADRSAAGSLAEVAAVSTVSTVLPPELLLSPAVASEVSPSSIATAPVRVDAPREALRFEHVWAHCAQHRWNPDARLLVFGNSDPFHPGAEQFRTLRSRLYRIRESQTLQTVLVSSAIPAEGKTLIAVNLAYSMVRQHGCRVLLIDADLRSPRVHTLLGAPEAPGLADYLQAGASEMEIIQRGREAGLCLIPAGNHVTHPSELISSNAMKHLLDRVKPAFDWIIIDSPPALPVADASVLGGLTDGVLFVVRAKSTPSEVAQRACKELRDAHILGVILNTADEDAGYSSYYGSSRYGHPETKSAKK